MPYGPRFVSATATRVLADESRLGPMCGRGSHTHRLTGIGMAIAGILAVVVQDSVLKT